MEWTNPDGQYEEERFGDLQTEELEIYTQSGDLHSDMGIYSDMLG